MEQKFRLLFENGSKNRLISGCNWYRNGKNGIDLRIVALSGQDHPCAVYVLGDQASPPMTLEEIEAHIRTNSHFLPDPACLGLALIDRYGEEVNFKDVVIRTA